EVASPPAAEPPPPETFIPQAAERAPSRAPRMPKFEDLPMPAQNEIRHARGEVEEEHPQKARMSLLQRLANVGGLARREPPWGSRCSSPLHQFLAHVDEAREHRDQHREHQQEDHRR